MTPSASQLRQVAQENEKWMDSESESAALQASSTIAVQVPLLMKHKLLFAHPSLSGKECKMDFHPSTCERVILDLARSRKNNSNFSFPPKVCCLNFADRHTPGGLYLKGVNTQEESLCRAIPALFRSLRMSHAYPYNSYETLLWTPTVWFQRNPDRTFEWLTQPLPLSIVSAAAPNLPAGEEYCDKRFRKLIEAILVCPYLYGNCEVLILGAFGTGAFRNDVAQVGKAFAHAVKKLGHLYSRIIFAIPEVAKLDLFAQQFF